MLFSSRIASRGGLLLVLFGGSACGGVVVFSEDGSGGAGGSTNQTATNQTATSTSVTSTNNSVSTTTDSVVVSSSTGPLVCDTGQPGDFGEFVCDDCINCSIDGPCSGIYNSCINSQGCLDFADCYQNCGSPNCANQCQMQFPNGAQLYFGVLDCIVCQQCPINCNAAQNCGGPPPP